MAMIIAACWFCRWCSPGTDTGHLNGTFLDPALIKRVEIVRGPSALLYGSGALGGVISYDTVDAKDLLQEGQSSGFRVFGTGGTGTIAWD